MFCASCTKLSYLYTQKPCVKCQGNVLNNISVLCETCSNSSKNCSVCLKRIEIQHRTRGCNCGK